METRENAPDKEKTPEQRPQQLQQPHQAPKTSRSSTGEFLLHTHSADTNPDQKWRTQLNNTLAQLVSLVPGAPKQMPQTSESLPQASTGATTTHPYRWSLKITGSTTTTTTPDDEDGQTTHRPNCPPSSYGDNPNPSYTIVRPVDAHDTSGHRRPGDREVSEHTLDNLNCPDKVLLTTTTVGHPTARQSPNPPTAPHAHSSNPPDEDCVPKRVTVRGQRYQHNNTTTVFCSQSFNNNDNNPQNVTAHNSKNYATVTPKQLKSSTTTTKGSGHELDQPQATVPGETVEMPVHPEPRNMHTAPQPVKQILVQLNKHVTQEFNQLKKTVQHHTFVQQHTCNHKNWHTIRQYLNTNVPDIDDHTVDQIISTAATPLLECIANHYNRIINQHYQHIFTMVNNTHHTLHSGATTNVSVQTATTTTLESIGDLIDHLKQNQQTLNTDTQQANETITHNHNSDNDNNNQYQPHSTQLTSNIMLTV